MLDLVERLRVGQTIADPSSQEIGTVKSFRGTELTIKWEHSTDIVNVSSELWQPWLNQLVILGEKN